MFDNKPQSRRAFLRHTGQLALSSTALPFALNLAAMGEAAAFNATTNDYKALVCVFLSGGNDYANTLVTYDATRHDKYTAIRGALALPKDALLDATLLKPAVVPQYLDPTLRVGGDLQYALHPSMTGMAGLFNEGTMAVQMNVGPLVKPISRADFDASVANRPPQLFSHPDQQTLWHSPSAQVEKKGWGGGAGDAALDGGLNTSGSEAYTCISVAGDSVFLSGTDALQYQVDRNAGAISINPTSTPYSSGALGAAIKTLIQKNTSSHKLENEYNTIVARAINTVDYAKKALSDTDFEALARAALPDDSLGRQLRIVARLIKGRASLGASGGPRRQVFFVVADNYDMHENLKENHPGALKGLSDGLTGFSKLMKGLALDKNVTSFTASDFGRTLAVNGGGSDHGWGSHHFVVGGAVIGKKFYGVPPPLSVSNDKVGGAYKPENQWHVGEGRLLPTTSVDQYAGTLAKWFGVSDTELPGIFPNINNFGGTSNGITYSKDMGFMGA